jgi:hypothetical protein
MKDAAAELRAIQRREDAALDRTAAALALAMPESVKALVLRPEDARAPEAPAAPVLRHLALRRRIVLAPAGSRRRLFYLAGLAAAEGKQPEDYPEWYTPPGDSDEPAGAAPEAPEGPADEPAD